MGVHMCVQQAGCLCVCVTARANVCTPVHAGQCRHVCMTVYACQHLHMRAWQGSVCVSRWWWSITEIKMPLINEEGLLN